MQMRTNTTSGDVQNWASGFMGLVLMVIKAVSVMVCVKEFCTYCCIRALFHYAYSCYCRRFTCLHNAHYNSCIPSFGVILPHKMLVTFRRCSHNLLKDGLGISAEFTPIAGMGHSGAVPLFNQHAPEDHHACESVRCIVSLVMRP